MRSKSTPAARGQETGRRYPGPCDRLCRRPLVAGLAAVAAAGLLAGCGSGNGSASATGGTHQKDAAGSTIATREVTGVGTVLTDQSGKTLYTPLQEAGGTIKCTGSCLSFWFPVTLGKGVTPHAARALTGTLGSIQRPDEGSRQLTYNGQPLYTFRLDHGSGQAHGNNFTDKFAGQSFTWHAITVSGARPAPGQPGSPSSSSPYQSGPGGY